MYSGGVWVWSSAKELIQAGAQSTENTEDASASAALNTVVLSLSTYLFNI